MKAADVPRLSVGDVVTLSSPVVTTSVADVSRWHVFLKWPWKEVDPASQFAWNGTLGFPRDEESLDWLNTPWRFDDPERDFTVGEEVEIWIPEGECEVLSVETLDVPMDIGWLPRPTLVIGLCRVAHLNEDEAGFALYCDTAEPISITRIR